MKTISLAKKAVAGILSAGATLLIAACYGPMSNGTYLLASGTVDVPEGTPDTYGVEACVEFTENGTSCYPVGSDGYYSTYAQGDLQFDDANLNGYRLCVRDPGQVFGENCIDVPGNTGTFTHDFSLDYTPVK